jgi:serine/threonine protein phosphatase PrpC
LNSTVTIKSLAMGTYLSTPITEKCDESGESLECITTNSTDDNNNNNGDVPVEWGVVDMQGWRKSMEDSHTAVTTVPIFNNSNNKEQQMARVFGVYDGHGGAEVARFCQYYFVDVLMNQPSWMEVNNNNENEDMNNENENRMPLTGDDERVPLPPPVPDLMYDGDGNEMGYRSKHLVNASETPVGKSLREAFHAMDRLIDDPTRQHEISILRSTKTMKGATKLLEDGFHSIPVIIPTVLNIAPDFYTKNKNQNTDTNSSSAAETTVVAALADVFDDADSLPVNKNIDDHAALPSAVGEDGRNEQAQADKSLSTVLTPEQAEVLKHEIEEFEKKTNSNNNANKEEDGEKDDDSDEAVGIEEAIVLDSNIDDDCDDDCDGITAEDAKTLPSTSSTSTTTTMLQKILSLGGAAVQAAAGTALPAEDDGDENENETSAIVTSSNDDDADDNNGSLTTTATGGTGTPTVTYPRSVDVSQQNVRYPSVIHNGRLVCNLPDHPIHAGATAVVAVITGKILTVANAGDSRAVLCRRRNRSRDGNTNNTGTDGNINGNNADDDGHYAFPLSYDHKPSQTHELNRILCSGGFVNHFGRINGNLNLSRSIGDLKYKQVPGIPPEDQMITAEPDIMQIVVEDEDEFIILGCDGIWDCLSNEQAVNFVMERIQTKTPVEIGTEMLDTIISDDPRITQGIGGDNMTIMIIDLQTSKRVRRRSKNTSSDDSLSPTKENDDDDNNMTTTSEAAME